MTSLPDITFIDEARKVGIHSFVYKHMGKDHFYYVIRYTMAGHGIYPGPSDSASFAVDFTDTEIAVLRLVCQGKTREESAKELGLSDTVLGRHITSILDKSGFDSISKFAIYAVGKGLITPIAIN
jgi:DNA-binding NarL/FixJ family response regulator